ncbi:loganic acid O-methyltransferase-like [Punica granatum]|nr:loganic acid O-methyltransferase-like [Punica granatum]OWM84638.1 hypothetical protein CDL15_Pgr027425 [Punica granatum]
MILQRWGVEKAKELIARAIAENLNVKQLVGTGTASCPGGRTTFSIADLGCSVGLNTFIAVENIVDSIKLKLNPASLSLECIEFQVFFNDLVSNDFNLLFKSLPSERGYFAAGVPGGFHGRLFPSRSLHFVHSSYALHWLSEVPKEVVDPGSPFYNKGRIGYATAPVEVYEAFVAKFSEDMERFLNARGEEVVGGGLLAFIIPCLSDGLPPSQCSLPAIGDVLGSALMDMVHQGMITEDKVDSFNLPRYHTSPKELTAIIERSGNFSIEMMEVLDRPPMPEVIDKSICFRMMVRHFRATLEGLIREQFGDGLVDQVFERFSKKLEESSIFTDPKYKPGVEMFVLLKRKIA